MKTIIRAEQVTKQFRIGARAAFPTLRDLVAGAARAPMRLARRGRAKGGAEADGRTLRALKGVSFRVLSGEVVGVVGRNGAGKSTLLKILSRITEPTSGRVELYGRVGALLEVGTGFHPELTGRENIFLNGAILGMRRTEIARRFDEIVAFSEIERFIDTPVKHYSSGMYVRLAFSVAAHLEPEILIVDEVLSVGDMAFRQKCLTKMSELRKQTEALLLVSHDMIAVRSICTRVMLLEGGVVAADGSPSEVVPLYEKLMREGARAGGERDEQEEGMGQVRIDRVRMLDAQGEERAEFEVGERLRVVVDYTALERVEGAVAYAAIRRPDELICVASSTRLAGLDLVLDGPGRAEVDVPELSVIPGHYFLDVTFYDENFEHRTYFLGRKKVWFEVRSEVAGLDEKYGVLYQQYGWKIDGVTK